MPPEKGEQEPRLCWQVLAAQSSLVGSDPHAFWLPRCLLWIAFAEQGLSWLWLACILVTTVLALDCFCIAGLQLAVTCMPPVHCSPFSSLLLQNRAATCAWGPKIDVALPHKTVPFPAQLLTHRIPRSYFCFTKTLIPPLPARPPVRGAPAAGAFRAGWDCARHSSVLSRMGRLKVQPVHNYMSDKQLNGLSGCFWGALKTSFPPPKHAHGTCSSFHQVGCAVSCGKGQPATLYTPDQTNIHPDWLKVVHVPMPLDAFRPASSTAVRSCRDSTQKCAGREYCTLRLYFGEGESQGARTAILTHLQGRSLGSTLPHILPSHPIASTTAEVTLPPKLACRGILGAARLCTACQRIQAGTRVHQALQLRQQRQEQAHTLKQQLLLCPLCGLPCPNACRP
eukprot:1157705-Pelagomonas_calceolata.AAC.2